MGHPWFEQYRRTCDPDAWLEVEKQMFPDKQSETPSQAASPRKVRNQKVKKVV